MVFHPPAWVPALPDVPDSITLHEFMTNPRYGRRDTATSKSPYTCGITGKTHTAAQVVSRIDHLARALKKRLNFSPNEDTEWDRVVAVYSVNTIDYIPTTHAIHRLNGIVTPASAAYSAPELEHQLRSSSAIALFTCVPLLETALKAARAVGITDDKIFILSMPGDEKTVVPFTTIDQLVTEGMALPELEPFKWVKGQGTRQVAYLCYSSGTSGLPKAVMLSHYNVIVNVIQTATFESVARSSNGIETQIILGLLPLSHIYALTLVALISQWRGDEVVILPRFELEPFLNAVQRFKIEQLSIVPPILVQLKVNAKVASNYDLSSVRFVFSGAAPLGSQLTRDIQRLYPTWVVGQGYGMTESSPLVTISSEKDVLLGSSGSLIPGYKAKIIDLDGNEVTEYEKRGELYIQSPSVALGYLHNEKASAETFVHHDDGRWLRTGDEVLMRKSSKGHEHVVVTDRIKELIKVKGHQVAPAELEAHLLAHRAVADCAVIPVQDDRAGEVPKAYVVRAAEAASESEEETVTAILKHVEEHKARHKWLKGGIEFIDVIPKSPSGKILRRLLREKEKEARRDKGPKL